MLKKLLLPIIVALSLCAALVSIAKADPSVYGGGIANRQPYMVRVAARAGGVLIDEASLFSAMSPTYTMEQLLSVIDPSDADWVLTCRHCVDETTGTGQYIDTIDKLWVRAGDYSTISYDGERHITVTEAVVPYPWDGTGFSVHDIAMLKLSDDQRREVSGTTTIIDFMPVASDEPPLDTNCLLYGWGNDGQPVREDHLKVVTLTVHARTEYIVAVSDSGFSGRGDSGGPFVCDGETYGVLSSGDSNQTAFSYTYTHRKDMAETVFSRGEGFTITKKTVDPYTYRIQGSIIADGLSINGLITRTAGLIQVDEMIVSDAEIDDWSVIGLLNRLTYTVDVNVVEEIEYRSLLPLVRK